MNATITHDPIEIAPPEQAIPRPVGPRVLVVDDDPLMRAMTSAMLHSEGWEVFHAGSADEATVLMKFCVHSHMPLSVVIMDLVMPGGMSGLEALGALRGIDPGVPVIATSGFFEDNGIARCKAFGFDGVLPKPYTSRQLCETLANYTARSSRTVQVPATRAGSAG